MRKTSTLSVYGWIVPSPLTLTFFLSNFCTSSAFEGSNVHSMEVPIGVSIRHLKSSGLKSAMSNTPATSTIVFRGVLSCFASRFLTAFVMAAEALPSCPLRLGAIRSEEHTSELQSLRHLVCRLLL